MSSAIRQVISIANNDLTILEHQGKRVVTLAMVDQVHQRPAGTAKRNFHENRSRFEEGKHYFLVSRACADEFRTLGVDIPNRGLTVLTERGYLLLVKSCSMENPSSGLARKPLCALASRMCRKGGGCFPA